MWIITGCFDEEDKQSKNTKSKLLKPGQTYNIGRKAREDTQLVINKSAISRDQGKVVVGPHSVDDVASVTAIPYVHYINLARSKNHLVRNKETVQHNIAQNDPVDLQSGDSLQLSSGNDKEPGVTLVFEWHSIYPLFLRLPKPRMTALSNRAAPLGIKIAKRPSSDITHLVVDQLDPSIAELYTSLMADAKVVNQDWWSDVCQRAEAPRGQEHSWEDLFAELEDLDRWAPALKDGLSPVQLKVDTRRKKIFDGLTFVLLSDASPASELTAQLELGGAKVESVDLLEAEITSISLIPRFMAMKKAASTRLAKSIRLEKGALIESLYVVIAKESVQSALGRTWAKYEEMISSLDLSILSVEQIHLSILNVSTDFIRHAASSRPLLDGSSQAGEELRTAPLMPGTASLSGKVVASSLPDEVPATLLEPGVSDDVQAPPTATQFKRRRGRTLVQDLFDDEDDEPVPPPAARGRTPETSATNRKAIPPSASKKRKRTVLETFFEDSIDEVPEVEPEYKRLKREEEERESSENYQKAGERAAAVIDAVYRQHHGESVEIPGMTQEELQATKDRRRTAASMLDEDGSREDSQSAAFSGRKRKPSEGRDVDMDDPESGRPQKRSAPSGSSDALNSEHVSGSVTTPTLLNPTSRVLLPTDGDTGPAPAPSPKATVTRGRLSPQKQKPASGTEVPMDTDPNFLQALASRKRGKKKEDQFDRDFNALRISAPMNGQPAPQESTDDYRVMDDLDFGGPAPVGNFMKVVLTKEVFRKDRDVSGPQALQKRHASGLDEDGVWRGQKPWDDPKWAARPNYKAFVRNNKRPVNRHPVSIALAPVEDYGMGNAYWKGDNHSGDSTQKTRQTRSTLRSGEVPQSLDEDFGGLNMASDRRGRTGTGTLDGANSAPRRLPRATSAVNDGADMDTSDVAAASGGNSREQSVENPTARMATTRTSVKRRIHTIEEDDDDDIHIVDTAPSNTRSKRSTPSMGARGASRKRVTDDEDSVIAVDDGPAEMRRRGLRGTGEAGSTLVSSGGKRTPVVSQQEQRKRTQALAAMDDSDDDIRVRRKRKK